jgi:hypothetical protein
MEYLQLGSPPRMLSFRLDIAGAHVQKELFWSTQHFKSFWVPVFRISFSLLLSPPMKLRSSRAPVPGFQSTGLKLHSFFSLMPLSTFFSLSLVLFSFVILTPGPPYRLTILDSLEPRRGPSCFVTHFFYLFPSYFVFLCHFSCSCSPWLPLRAVRHRPRRMWALRDSFAGCFTFSISTPHASPFFSQFLLILMWSSLNYHGTRPMSLSPNLRA